MAAGHPSPMLANSWILGAVCRNTTAPISYPRLLSYRS